ncbi:Imm26 family immunity protein [Gottfriedia acidiceleris]|uniref:Immunity 26/phosphotriesterase HocA family protein n=1 Tax=Gottfriedia acidiceleris TaxID=371036 RepID=A0ABY4JQI7_9BACI|nr:Imm26 family immunity protein [Gottfriedia acidiceleris]UPM56096.1 immunity 26/phosphotriesterase HocA family protein [Gottfriedia acidiceleris]
MRKVSYPFLPKSNSFLIPGQFWAIPLKNNKFACGRVIEVSKEDKRGFLAGLMDWVGDEPPTSESIAGKKTLMQGDAHIKTIHETGFEGMVLGYRSLEEDDIVPDMFKSESVFSETCKLMKGYEKIRPINKEEWEKYSTFSTWGYLVIKNLAEDFFCKTQ